MAPPLTIAYFGLPLGALLLARDGHTLSTCVLSPVPAPGLHRLKTLGIPLVEARSAGPALESTVSERLERAPPDLLVSWFWTRRLPQVWLSQARKGALGVHPSLLPRHRGPNPYFWTVDSGDLETGVTVHLLEAEYDTGAILEQERVVVGHHNTWQLARALDRPSLRALRRVLAAYARGTQPTPRAQDEALATPAPEPSGELLRVDFGWPTERILRRVRALAPVPGVALSLGDHEFFLVAASETPHYTGALFPGEAQIDRDRLVLRTGNSAIQVERALVFPPDDRGELTLLPRTQFAAWCAERLTSRSGRCVTEA